MTDDSPEPAFARIGDPDWLKANDLFVAEGRHVTRRLLQSPKHRATAALVTPTALDAIADALEALAEPNRLEILAPTRSIGRPSGRLWERSLHCRLPSQRAGLTRSKR